jgi:TonB-dependent SusC/RagA subfamily outer membrane receptor
MKRLIRKYAWTFVPLIALFLLNFDTNDDIRVDKIITQLDVFRTKYTQQKINFHTDKDTYMGGENIWLKCYLLNAFTFMPDSVSKEIYVDLIDFNNKHIQSIILRNKEGFSEGNILINDTLAEGNYQLRAYTNWMRNFDSDFFYNKTVKIVNPNYENVVTPHRLKEVKKFNKNYAQMQNDFVVNFFPEGGDLVAGFESKVAFKAENKLGNGVDMSGILYNTSGEQVAAFQTSHMGMGFFTFTPSVHAKYYAKVKFGQNKKEEKVYLSTVRESGISMAIDPYLPDYVRINIRANRSVSANIASNEIILVGQARGRALYVSKGELKEKPIEVLVPKNLFPSGIVQFTVFDARLNPTCERLVFIDYTRELKENKLEVTEQINGDSSVYMLKLSSQTGSPVKGNMSISVTEFDSNEDVSKSDILTQLLLTSDLKGRIENPSYYFTGNRGTHTNLDLVMLTHGWRRFVWKDILSNNFPVIMHQPSMGLTIEGQITNNFFRIPIQNSKVRLSILSSYNDVYETVTDSKGRFIFPNLDYEDTMDVKIEAFKPTGGKGVMIYLGDTVVPDIATLTNAELRNVIYPKDKIKANSKREREIARKGFKEKNVDQDYQFKIHETPGSNDIIYVGQDASNYSNILQYMQGRVAGVNITGNKVLIRGISTFYGSTDPLFLLDGVPIDAAGVPSLSPTDIARIEILKGPNASIYGSRGANGVIAFYSRRGEYMKRGVIEFGMKGYHKIVEFYVPSYDSLQYKPQDYKVPRTLYWQPNIVTNTVGTAKVKFKNVFRNEHTVVTIEGITDTGEIIYYRQVAR